MDKNEIFVILDQNDIFFSVNPIGIVVGIVSTLYIQLIPGIWVYMSLRMEIYYRVLCLDCTTWSLTSSFYASTDIWFIYFADHINSSYMFGLHNSIPDFPNVAGSPYYIWKIWISCFEPQLHRLYVNIYFLDWASFKTSGVIKWQILKKIWVVCVEPWLHKFI